MNRTNKVMSRPSTEIKCSDCGKTATVNFKPTAGKPVYCRECLAKHRPKRMDAGSRGELRSQKPDNEKQAWSRRREGWKHWVLLTKKWALTSLMPSFLVFPHATIKTRNRILIFLKANAATIGTSWVWNVILVFHSLFYSPYWYFIYCLIIVA